MLCQQLRRFGAAVFGKRCRVHQRVNHVLHPFGARLDVVVVHHAQAAGVVAPDVARKAQDFAHAFGFRQRVKRLGNDESADLLGRQRRHHVGRRHHGEPHLPRLRVFSTTAKPACRSICCTMML